MIFNRYNSNKKQKTGFFYNFNKVSIKCLNYLKTWDAVEFLDALNMSKIELKSDKYKMKNIINLDSFKKLTTTTTTIRSNVIITPKICLTWRNEPRFSIAKRLFSTKTHSGLSKSNNRSTNIIKPKQRLFSKVIQKKNKKKLENKTVEKIKKERAIEIKLHKINNSIFNVNQKLDYFIENIKESDLDEISSTCFDKTWIELYNHTKINSVPYLMTYHLMVENEHQTESKNEAKHYIEEKPRKNYELLASKYIMALLFSQVRVVFQEAKGTREGEFYGYQKQLLALNNKKKTLEKQLLVLKKEQASKIACDLKIAPRKKKPQKVKIFKKKNKKKGKKKGPRLITTRYAVILRKEEKYSDYIKTLRQLDNDLTEKINNIQRNIIKIEFSLKDFDHQDILDFIDHNQSLWMINVSYHPLRKYFLLLKHSLRYTAGSSKIEQYILGVSQHIKRLLRIKKRLLNKKVKILDKLDILSAMNQESSNYKVIEDPFWDYNWESNKPHYVLNHQVDGIMRELYKEVNPAKVKLSSLVEIRKEALRIYNYKQVILQRKKFKALDIQNESEWLDLEKRLRRLEEEKLLNNWNNFKKDLGFKDNVLHAYYLTIALKHFQRDIKYYSAAITTFGIISNFTLEFEIYKLATKKNMTLVEEQKLVFLLKLKVRDLKLNKQPYPDKLKEPRNFEYFNQKWLRFQQLIEEQEMVQKQTQPEEASKINLSFLDSNNFSHILQQFSIEQLSLFLFDESIESEEANINQGASFKDDDLEHLRLARMSYLIMKKYENQRLSSVDLAPLPHLDKDNFRKSAILYSLLRKYKEEEIFEDYYERMKMFLDGCKPFKQHFREIYTILGYYLFEYLNQSEFEMHQMPIIEQLYHILTKYDEEKSKEQEEYEELTKEEEEYEELTKEYYELLDSQQQLYSELKKQEEVDFENLTKEFYELLDSEKEEYETYDKLKKQEHYKKLQKELKYSELIKKYQKARNELVIKESQEYQQLINEFETFLRPFGVLRHFQQGQFEYAEQHHENLVKQLIEKYQKEYDALNAKYDEEYEALKNQKEEEQKSDELTDSEEEEEQDEDELMNSEEQKSDDLTDYDSTDYDFTDYEEQDEPYEDELMNSEEQYYKQYNEPYDKLEQQKEEEQKSDELTDSEEEEEQDEDELTDSEEQKSDDLTDSEQEKKLIKRSYEKLKTNYWEKVKKESFEDLKTKYFEKYEKLKKEQQNLMNFEKEEYEKYEKLTKKYEETYEKLTKKHEEYEKIKKKQHYEKLIKKYSGLINTEEEKEQNKNLIKKYEKLIKKYEQSMLDIAEKLKKILDMMNKMNKRRNKKPKANIKKKSYFPNKPEEHVPGPVRAEVEEEKMAKGNMLSNPRTIHSCGLKNSPITKNQKRKFSSITNEISREENVAVFKGKQIINLLKKINKIKKEKKKQPNLLKYTKMLSEPIKQNIIGFFGSSLGIKFPYRRKLSKDNPIREAIEKFFGSKPKVFKRKKKKYKKYKIMLEYPRIKEVEKTDDYFLLRRIKDFPTPLALPLKNKENETIENQIKEELNFLKNVKNCQKRWKNLFKSFSQKGKIKKKFIEDRVVLPLVVISFCLIGNFLVGKKIRNNRQNQMVKPTIIGLRGRFPIYEPQAVLETLRKTCGMLNARLILKKQALINYASKRYQKLIKFRPNYRYLSKEFIVVFGKWVGGLLTNFKNLSRRIVLEKNIKDKEIEKQKDKDNHINITQFFKKKIDTVVYPKNQPKFPSFFISTKNNHWPLNESKHVRLKSMQVVQLSHVGSFGDLNLLSNNSPMTTRSLTLLFEELSCYVKHLHKSPHKNYAYFFNPGWFIRLKKNLRIIRRYFKKQYEILKNLPTIKFLLKNNGRHVFSNV